MKFMCTTCGATLVQSVKRYRELLREDLSVVTSVNCPLCDDAMEKINPSYSKRIKQGPKWAHAKRMS